MSFEFNTISIFNNVSAVIVVVGYTGVVQACSGGGFGSPVPHLDMHPLEPQGGSNSLNSKLAYIFRFFTFLINRQCHNLSIL